MTQQPPGQEKLVEYVEDDERAEPGPNGEDPQQAVQLDDAATAPATEKKPFRSFVSVGVKYRPSIVTRSRPRPPASIKAVRGMPSAWTKVR